MLSNQIPVDEQQMKNKIIEPCVSWIPHTIVSMWTTYQGEEFHLELSITQLKS